MDPDTWHCLIHVSGETDFPLVDITPQNILVSSVLPACFSAVGVSGIMWCTRACTRAPSLACHWINEFLCVSTPCPCSSEWAVHVFVLRIYRKVNSCLCWNEVRCPGKTNTQELKSRNEGHVHGAADFCITEAPLQLRYGITACIDKIFVVLTSLLGLPRRARQKCLFSTAVRSLETNDQDRRFYL